MDTVMNNRLGSLGHRTVDGLEVKYPIHKACRDGDLESLTILLRTTHPQTLLNEDDYYGWTPAHWAAYFGHLSCLRQVSNMMALELKSTRYHQTLLHLAAFAGHPHCLQWLIQNGFPLHTTDCLGETALHKAARTGSMECVNVLASGNADLSLRNNMGMTAAALAARCGFADCSLYLQRVAEQQHLKASGMINGISLPIMPHQEVLPGQKPDKGFILQGLNGGQLPNVIDSENHSNGFHTEMDHQSYMHNNINGFHQKHDFCVPHGNGLLDGYTEHQNAINENHNFLANCQSLCDTQGNHMFSAGRKRRLDGCIEPYDEFKRIRQLDDGQNQGQFLFTGHLAKQDETINPIHSADTTRIGSEFMHEMDQKSRTPADALQTTIPSYMATGTEVDYFQVSARQSLCSHNFLCSHKFKNAPCI